MNLPPLPLPIRPTRQELTEVLIAAGDGVPLLADRLPAAIGWGCQHVDVALAAGLWRLRIWWLDDGALGSLSSATGPGRREWCYGCDRWPDWDAGPVAVPLDPLRHLLTQEQRERLADRLQRCSCWPPLPAPRGVPPLADAIWSLEEFEELGRG